MNLIHHHSTKKG